MKLLSAPDSVKIVKLLLLPFILLLMITVISNKASAGYLITPFSADFCSDSYPTPYQTVSFTLEETSMDGFDKNQSDKTFVITLPAGFEFNTSAGTVNYLQGGDLASAIIQSLTTSELTLLITINNTKKSLDVLTFSNFQIRAISASSGTLLRSGGSFQIDKSASNPTEAFGSLQTSSAMSWSTKSTVAQLETSAASPGGVKLEILRIQVSTDGACTPYIVQKICLNTDGSNGTGSNNPATNITKAQIWYSGSSPLFLNASTLFGELSSPNGSFKISGDPDIVLSDGDNYFWLTYDIPVSAVTGENLDARLDSIIVSGMIRKGEGSDFAEMNPAGSRSISTPSVFYSLADGDWGAKSWATSEGGSNCGCAPTADAIVYISNAISLLNNQTAQSVIIRNGGSLILDRNNKSLTVSNSLSTEGSGYFDASRGTLIVNGNIFLSGSGNSLSSTDLDINGTLTVGSGTILSLTGGDASVAGNLEVDGTLNLGSNKIILDGGTTNIHGSGSVTGTGSIDITAGDKIISSSADLSIACGINILGSYTISNYAKISVSGDISGNSASSVWKNAASSTLHIQGMLLQKGSLEAYADFNTISYEGKAAHLIKEGTYYNLMLSNGTMNTLSGDINVKGDLSVANFTSLDVSPSNFTLTLSGDWNDSGFFIPQSGKVVFNGETNINSINFPEIFNEIQVDNGATLTIPANNAVSLSSSVINNGKIILQSPDNDGPTASWIDNGTITGSGEFNIERYIISGRYWFVAPAVSNATSIQFDAANANTRLYWYNEPTSWTGISDNSAALSGIRGYIFKNTVSNQKLIFTGKANTGSKMITTSYTPGSAKPGWNLVCNPYPSAIDWDAASGWTKENLMNMYWISINNVIASYNGETGIGTNGGSKEIAPMQSFWVKDTLGGGQMGMTNAVRIHSNTTNLKSKKTFRNILRLSVDDGVTSDETVLYFHKTAKKQHESKDTEKNFASKNFAQLYTKSDDNIKLAVNSLNIKELKKDIIIPVYFKANKAGDYTIHASELSSFDESLAVFLEDTKENIYQDLRAEGEYSFSARPGNSVRFKIHFSKIDSEFDDILLKSEAIEIVEFEVDIADGNAIIEWTTSNEENSDYFEIERSLNGSDFESIATIKASGFSTQLTDYSYIDNQLPKGTTYYRLKNTSTEKSIAHSDIIAVSNITDDKPCELKVNPNPCIEECVVFFESCEGSEDQDVSFAIYDALGNVVYSSMPKAIQEGKASFSFDPKNHLKPAIYIVRGQGNIKEATDKKVIISN